MQREAARVLGLQALGWLASDDELFAGFLAMSGSDVATVKASADRPELLMAVLDYILENDSRALACAGACGCGAQQVMMARAVLGGRDQMHWT